MNEVVASDARFGLELYGKLRGRSGNLAIAPSSIATALTMTYAGAKGTTAEQMARVLHVALPPEQWHAARGDLQQALTPGTGAPYQLMAADALWGQSGYQFDAGFLSLTRNHYRAGLHDVDFVSDPTGACKKINAWVAEQTKDKIKDILPESAITPLTRLVLTDALYFLGDWEHQFPESASIDEPFHLTGDQTAPVKMMHQTTAFGLAEDEDVQVLELQYKGKALSMLVVLPRKVDGLDAVESRLSLERLEGWRAALKAQKVNVSLPRFKIEVGTGLVPPLKALGMTDAFDDKTADFSGIAGKPHELFITDALHKVYVDVNERGTEAAAATAIVVGLRAAARPAPIPVFRADHPFLFLIRHNTTGAVLFLGRVADPRGDANG
jgi:serpin B